MSTPTTDPLVIRRLEASDHSRGYLTLLSQLTTAPPLSLADFTSRLDLLASLAPTHTVFVIHDTAADQVVAACSVLIEFKFARGMGKCAHIEDVVVDESYRGKSLGKKVIGEAVRFAGEEGCYKVILDCEEKNVPFYEKCGFKKKEIQMAHYF
mmetsp:Transcript_22685/g.56352  ORF Transcript_22685/g.56352 Transcript_22685/m.56352 type:complete len:153 (-) Transcript_22685:2299-2757(-)